MAGFTYDARGRLTGAGNISYTYDVENNRIRVSNGAQQTSYTINPNAPLSKVLIQTDAQGNQTFYVYGLGLIGQEAPDGGYSSYHFDRRGSTIALTNESGQVTDRFQYATYGELTYRNGNTATPFQFSGRYGVMTDESDLYYMRARYYNPVAKRFISPDTLTGQMINPQSLNLYIYCAGNPVNYVDPTGHNWIIIQQVGDKAVRAYQWAAPRVASGAQWIGQKATEAATWVVEKVAGKAGTGTIWDSIKATQPLNPGTTIPKSFELTVGESKFWVHPNATKHMAEYLTRMGSKMTDQVLLSSFKAATEQAMRQGIQYEKMIKIGNWELIFSKPRAAGQLPVIKHALYIP